MSAPAQIPVNSVPKRTAPLYRGGEGGMLKFSVEGGVGIPGLDRPEARNALPRPLMLERFPIKLPSTIARKLTAPES